MATLRSYWNNGKDLQVWCDQGVVFAGKLSQGDGIISISQYPQALRVLCVAPPAAVRFVEIGANCPVFASVSVPILSFRIAAISPAASATVNRRWPCNFCDSHALRFPTAAAKSHVPILASAIIRTILAASPVKFFRYLRRSRIDHR
jgi:hypothetical protein